MFSETVITSKHGQTMAVRQLNEADAHALGEFFDALSNDTRKRYGPHPLNTEHAQLLCQPEQLQHDQAERLVILDGTNIVGYMILTLAPFEHEIARYHDYDINLPQGKHWIFAPVIADDYQSHGLASAVMALVIEHGKNSGIDSIVLMGGTQKSNAQAVRFYQKNGFVSLGEFQTDVANIDMYLPLTNA